MMKLVKWLVGLTLVVVLLLVAAAVILPLVIDPNDYKDEIVAAVKKETGRDLVLRDSLELSVFPKIAVRLGGVSLSNAPGFGDEPFAQVEKLDLQVDLMPLLDKRIEVNTVVLDGLALNLARNAEGVTNWQDLAGGEDKPADTDAASAPKQSDSGPGISSFAVQGVQITNAQVSWDDRQAGQRYDLTDVKLVTGAVTPGDPVSLDGGLKFASEKPKLNLTLGVTGTVKVNADFTQTDITGLVLELFAIGEGLPEAGAQVRVSGDIAVDQSAKRIAVSNLVADGGVVQLTGGLEATNYDVKPAVTGEFELKETDLRQLMALVGVTVETADPAVLKSLSGKFGVQPHGKKSQGIAIKPLQVKLDDSVLKGNIRIPNFKGPTIRTKLTLDEIDIDRYLPPKSEDGGQATDGAKPQDPAASDDPLASLRPLDLQANLEIGRLKVNNARMRKVQLVVKSKQGVLNMDPITAKLYQGDFAGKVRLDAREKTPTIKAVKHLTGIQVGPLLRDVAGQDRLTGTGEVHADVTLRGMSEPQIRKTLNGNMRFAFTDGALKGINLANLIRTAQAKLLGGASDSGPAQTDFSELSASAVIKNGVIDNQDLQAKSPLLRVDGKGRVDLPADTIDYRVVTTIVKTLQGQGGKGRDQLTGVPIPVRFTGPLQSPKPQVDLQAALEGAATEKVKEKVQEKVQDAVGDKLKAPLGDKLKGVLGR